MEVYFVKSGISLIILYTAYRFLLRQPQRHQHNRFLGLFCIIFSAVLPFISFEAVQLIENTTVVAIVTTVSDGLTGVISEPVKNSSFNLYWVAYIVGVLFFSIRFLRGLIQLLVFFFKGEKSHQWGFYTVKVNQDLSPFTFFNILFVGKEKMNEEDLKILLAHERCHSRQWHSLDSLLLEFATILFWFNPIMWFFQRDIRAEHEYIADQSVLQTGVELIDYQHLLFKAGTGVSVTIGNNLNNKVSLIKRFNMMKKVETKTKALHYRIGLHALLIVVITLFSAFTSPDILAGDTGSEPVYKEGQEKMYRLFRTQIKYPRAAVKAGSVGQVVVSFRVNKDGSVDQVKTKQRKGKTMPAISVVGYRSGENTVTSEVSTELEEEVVRVVKLLGEFIPAEKDGRPVSAIVNIPFIFKLK